MPIVQIAGGGFQDSEGNLLAFGKLVLRLSSPATDPTGTIQICNDLEFSVPLDADGNIVTSPVQHSAWPNDIILPAGTYYMAKVYNASGELSWGPNAVFIESEPSPFFVNDWVPSNPS